MKEVKTPKKPLAYYYGIVLIVLIVFNLVGDGTDDVHGDLPG